MLTPGEILVEGAAMMELVTSERSGPTADAADRFVVRDFSPDDQPMASWLYRCGMFLGQLDPYDPATDVEHIEEAYILRPPNHFWVAEAEGQVVGTIAIAQDRGEVAHLRRLRVAPKWQPSRRVAGRLVQVATAHAREHGFLKLVLHTPVDDQRALPLLHKLGFEFARRREVNGRRVLEFYLNLYSSLHPMDCASEEEWRLV